MVYSNANEQFINLSPPTILSFPNPVSGVFLYMVVKGGQTYTTENLLQAMELACGDRCGVV